MKENPFKIEKGISIHQFKGYNSELVEYLIESLSKLFIEQKECVLIPENILKNSDVYSYVGKARNVIRTKEGFEGVKFKIRKLKGDNKESGSRVFRIS